MQVFNENWVVYHYFNVRAHRFEFSVLEIYDKNRIVSFLFLIAFENAWI